MDTTTFAKKIKEKYPEYANLDDKQLVDKVVAKYPVYRSQITDFAEPPKKTFLQDAVGDFKSIGEGILSGAQKAGDKLGAIQADTSTNKFSKGLQAVGAIAGAGASAIGSTLQGAANIALPETAEKKVTETIGKGIANAMQDPVIAAVSQKAQNWYNNLNEEGKKNVDAVGGIASLVGEFVGTGAAGKAASVTKRAVEEGLDATLDAAKRTGTAVGKTVGEVVPSTSRIANTQITKALDLTQGDVKNINLSTGNEVGEFIADRNLIGANKADTEKLIKDFYEAKHAEVRSEIGKVAKEYSQVEVPRMRQALTEIQRQVKEVPGLENASSEVTSLLGKEKVTLNDVQRVKELMDDHFSLYKATGDVKETAAKEGLANIRRDIKEFIEKEVKDNVGTDIGPMNNEVATSRAITDAVAERSTRGLTRANLRIGDLGVFGLGSALGSPLVGLAALAAKKIIEAPAVQLRLARYLDRISDAKKLRIQKALEAGKVPPEIKKIVGQSSSLENQRNGAKTSLIKKDNTPISKSIPIKKETSKALSPETKENIVDIIDDYRLNKGKNLSLQEDAARIAEDLGIEKPKTYAALVNRLEALLNDTRKVKG